MNTDAQRTMIVPERKKVNNEELISKTKRKTPSAKPTKTNTLIDKMNEIGKMVETHLGKYKNDYEIITSLERLNEYINTVNRNKIVSIDTETTGLSPIMDKIVGMSLYTPGERGIYIPMNHVDYITEERLPNQLYELEVKTALDNLTADVVMFNAVFDIRVIRNQVGNYLKCFWDCYLAGKLMNENEPNSGLKALHEKYVLKGEDKEFSFGQLFEKISFDKIPIEYAYIYAAHDAVITFELYEFQKKYLNADGRNGMNKVYDVFMNIEMPCVDVICNMEDTGFVLDMEYQKELHDKYHNLLNEEYNKLVLELKKHEEAFKKWQKSSEANLLIQKKDKDGKPKVDKKGNPEYEKTKKEKLPENIEDINLGSPSQLSILLYDIMGLKHSSKKDKENSTSEAALKSINIDFTNMLLDYRSFRKLIDAFIDSLPEHLEKDGKIHCSLNAYGAKTGRFSCSDPNLQQIPSKNKEIRKLFVAPTNYRDTENRDSFLTFKNTEEILIDGNNKWAFVKDLKVGDTIFNNPIVSIKNSGNNIEIGVKNVLSIETRERYVLIGADYSQQEPKLLATVCQDKNMMRDASEGKDLYSAVASRAFHTTYEECLEHFPEGTPIKEENGKWRYATDMEMCNEKYDKIADGENDTYADGKARRTQAKVILLGMMYGRGPKALAEQLKCSTEEAKEIMDSVFNAFPDIKRFDNQSKEFARKYGFTMTLWGRKRRLPDLNLPPYEFDYTDSIISEGHRKELEIKTIQQLKENYWNQAKKDEIKNDINKRYKVKIKENTGFIAQAERQVLNSIIQGSAADMTKKALIAVGTNKELKDLGFQLIVPVHDEILAQCPLANVKRCKEIFTYEMSNAARDKVDIKITVDPAISFAWYGEPIVVE